MDHAGLAGGVGEAGAGPPAEGADAGCGDELGFDAGGEGGAGGVGVPGVEEGQEGEHGIEGCGRVDVEGFGEGRYGCVPEVGVEVCEGCDPVFGQAVEGRAHGAGVGDHDVDEGDLGSDFLDGGGEAGFGGYVALDGDDGAVDGF